MLSPRIRARFDAIKTRPEAILSTGLGLACLALLAGWLPHYLTWPWWPDHDTNAAMALGWSRGILPYRDVTAFTFPGQMYLFRITQGVFGPGKTWPMYAVDGGLIVGLCAALLLWSRKGCGRFLPGWLGVLAVLSYFMGLNFSLAAQRDGQAAILATMGLLAVSGWPGRGGRLVSAVLLGLAVAFRPHVVLFLPAMVLGAWMGGRWRGVAEWAGVFSAAVLLVFAPLLYQGLVPDFLRGVRLASYGGTYSRATVGSVAAAVVRQAFDLRYLCVPAVLGGAWKYGGLDEADRRRIAVGLAAAAGGALYKPAHPFAHDYLAHAAWVVWAMLVALLGMLLATSPRLARAARVGALMLLAGLAFPGKPEFFNPRASVAAVRGRSEGMMPPGYVHHMSRYQVFLPEWEDYRRLLEHLRATDPETPVANLLKYQLAVNGAAGRVSPFRNESGLLWLTQVGKEESDYVGELMDDPRTLVVWSPGLEGPDPGFAFPEIERVVRERFEPVARFGGLEVWGRRGESEGEPASRVSLGFLTRRWFAAGALPDMPLRRSEACPRPPSSPGMGSIFGLSEVLSMNQRANSPTPPRDGPSASENRPARA